MKKASVILVALLLLVGMSVSAQSKWTVWGEGIMYPFYKVGDADAGAGWGPINWGTDTGSVTGQYNQWTFAYDADNFGYYAVFAFDGKAFGAIDLARFAAYYKFGSLVKLTMGAPRINYTAFSFIEGNHLGRWNNGSYATALEAFPIEGLSVGAEVIVDNVDPELNLGPDWGKMLGFAASYVLPNIATIYANTRLDQEYFNVSADVTALKDIGIMAGLKYTWTDGASGIFALAGAKMPVGPAKVALEAALQTNAGLSADVFAFGVDVDGQYALNDKWNVGVTVGYDNGVGNVGSGEGTPGAGFSVFPYLKAGFGDSYVKFGFVYASGFDNDIGVVDATMAIPIMYVISW